MASSSSNKMPMLVDRPLHSFATLGDVAALTTSTNFSTVSAGGCQLVVDCSANDGAVVDSVSVIATEAGTTASSVLVLLSTAFSNAAITQTNTVVVASGVIGSSSAGERTHISLPPLSVPMPHLASPAATVAAYPSETDKKNTGLYVPSGALLYVGLNAVLSAPSASSKVHVFVQGGFF